MNASQNIAKHLKEVHFGGNWTCSNLKDQLEELTWEQATTAVHGLNSIAALAYHINYFISGVTKVLEGGALTSKDKFSYDHPPIRSQEDWEQMLTRIWMEGERFEQMISALPEEQLAKDFVDKKYGSHFRNLFGIIEHSHYHLGQIAVIKKLVLLPYI